MRGAPDRSPVRRRNKSLLLFVLGFAVCVAVAGLSLREFRRDECRELGCVCPSDESCAPGLLCLDGTCERPLTDADLAPVVPEGWDQVMLHSQRGGLLLYRKGSSHVVILDIRRVEVALLVDPGQVSEPAPGYGLIEKHSAAEFHEQAELRSAADAPLRVLFGGACGVRTTQPSQLAFGLKVDSRHITWGYAAPGGPKPEFPGHVEIVALNNQENRVWIGDYEPAVFSRFPDIMGALDVLAPTKERDVPLGRTFIGVRDSDGDGMLETLMVLVSAKSTQADASAALQNFGAQEQTMLCGDTTTFLMVDGKFLVGPSDTLIPQATAVYALK
jgi:hypothetical protein